MQITPTVSLNWTNCYDGKFQCARLSVPLDYSNTADKQAAIAMVRIPSPYGLNGSDEYRGPVLFNPGGPGQSGVSNVIGSLGAELQARIGDKYDIVGFDPRGIQRSTPEISRFPTPLAAAIWGESGFPALIPVASIPGNIGLTLAKAEVTNPIYGKTGASYLPFMNTPFVAMDMLQIAQAHGMEKINYYGVSYGTILGAVFATMFPDKVERMVLDGVADTEAWFRLNLTAEITDLDKAIGTFFQSCFEAGSEQCAFWAESPVKISENLDVLYSQLKMAPLPAFVDNGSFYGVVDFNFMRHTMRIMPYSPYERFQPLAEALAALSQGNADLFFELGVAPPQNDPCSCGIPDPFVNNIDVMVTYTCNDGDAVNKTFEGWNEYYQSALEVSDYADTWVALAMRCQSWPTTEKNPVRGPWGSNTSSPILFIGNTIDPVTPLASAKKMSSLFPGSMLLTQNSTGHTTLTAHSECTTDAFLNYFKNATLPSAGTTCQIEDTFFPPTNGTSGA